MDITLHIAGISEAESMLTSPFCNLTDVVSINSREICPPNGLQTIPHVLHLRFDDSVSLADPDAPQPAHIECLIRFYEDILKRAKTGERISLLCHCFGGISRSSAEAFIFEYMCRVPPANPKDGAEAAMVKVATIRPRCTPNLLMLAQADQILNANWELWKSADCYIESLRYCSYGSIYIQ